MYWEPCGVARFLEDLMQQSSLLCLAEDQPGTEMITDLAQMDWSRNPVVCLPLLSAQQLRGVMLEELRKFHKYKSFSTELVAVVDPPGAGRVFLLEAKDCGVSRVVIPLDVAHKQLFSKYHSGAADDLWIKYWRCMEEATAIFGFQKVIVNLFAGMGETEEEFIAAMQRIDDLGAVTCIYSAQENRALGVGPYSIGKYRRLQMARFLLEHQLTTVRQMQFNQFGSVFEFGIHPRKLEELLELGTPFFETGGYGCSRLSKPWPGHDNYSGGVRNYPQPLTKEEAQQAKKEFYAVNWEEEFKLVTQKVQREGVDFQDIDMDINFKSLGFVPGITKEDLRYLKSN